MHQSHFLIYHHLINKAAFCCSKVVIRVLPPKALDPKRFKEKSSILWYFSNLPRQFSADFSQRISPDVPRLLHAVVGPFNKTDEDLLSVKKNNPPNHFLPLTPRIKNCWLNPSLFKKGNQFSGIISIGLRCLSAKQMQFSRGV